MIISIAVICMAVGLAGVLRAVAIVSVGGAGRIPYDPWISLAVGFGLILMGQGLLRL